MDLHIRRQPNHKPAGALAKTRDLFCFCAFTSLRYSDMAKLRRVLGRRRNVGR